MIAIAIRDLLIITAILIVFTFVLVAYLLIQRKREIAKQKIRDAYIKRTELLWYSYLLEEGNFYKEMIPTNEYEIEAAENILLTYLRNTSNYNIRLKIYYFAKAHFLEYYKHGLESKSWSKRMNTMYRISDFRLASLVKYTEKLKLKNRSLDEQFQILKMYSLLSKNKFVEKFLATKITFSETEYRMLFSLVEDEILVELLTKLDFLKLSAQYALIDTIALNGNMQFVELLEQLITHNNPEIRIRTLKALERIGVIKNIEMYTPFVQSSLWEERLMIAKLFKHAPLSYTYPHLELLLQDENWWVRSQAANTIIDNRGGSEKLQQFVQTATDRYAIEIANEVLAKRKNVI